MSGHEILPNEPADPDRPHHHRHDTFTHWTNCHNHPDVALAKNMQCGCGSRRLDFVRSCPKC